MTDNEIIKALECCLHNDGKCPKDCPLRHDNDCSEHLSNEVFDLINRQKAELEFAKNINGKTVGKLISDLEDLQNFIQKAKAEAVKEFADRLKEKLQDDCPTITAEEDDFSGYDIFETDEIIDNLVKEMVGAESG